MLVTFSTDCIRTFVGYTLNSISLSNMSACKKMFSATLRETFRRTFISVRERYVSLNSCSLALILFSFLSEFLGHCV